MPTGPVAAGTSAVGGYLNLSQYSEDHRNTQSLEELYGESSSLYSCYPLLGIRNGELCHAGFAQLAVDS
jgi:hypothetical protein